MSDRKKFAIEDLFNLELKSVVIRLSECNITFENAGISEPLTGKITGTVIGVYGDDSALSKFNLVRTEDK